MLEAGLANSHEVLLKATRGQELIAFASWILPHEEEEVHSAPGAGKIVLPPGTDEALYLDFFPKLGEFKKTIKELHYRNSLADFYEVLLFWLTTCADCRPQLPRNGSRVRENGGWDCTCQVGD